MADSTCLHFPVPDSMLLVGQLLKIHSQFCDRGKGKLIDIYLLLLYILLYIYYSHIILYYITLIYITRYILLSYIFRMIVNNRFTLKYKAENS